MQAAMPGCVVSFFLRLLRLFAADHWRIKSSREKAQNTGKAIAGPKIITSH